MNEASAKKSRANYNIHALKLRQLELFNHESRFRQRFQE